MRLWLFPEGVVPSGRSSFRWQPPPILTLQAAFWLMILLVDGGSSFGMHGTFEVSMERSKSASPFVGSAMAVLATLQQAEVLPPEGSREADRVIQSVIQIQSAFAKGTDPSVQDFVRRALVDKHGEAATTMLEQFRASGWTADMLESLSDAESKASREERQGLATGLGQFNLSTDDFRRFMQLVRDGRTALAARGLNFEEVYTRHRNTMPGGASR